MVSGVVPVLAGFRLRALRISAQTYHEHFREEPTKSRYKAYRPQIGCRGTLGNKTILPTIQLSGMLFTACKISVKYAGILSLSSFETTIFSPSKVAPSRPELTPFLHLESP